jgi:hypothetical protein
MVGLDWMIRLTGRMDMRAALLAVRPGQIRPLDAFSA